MQRTTPRADDVNAVDFLKPKEAASIVRLSQRAIYDAIIRKELRAAKLGGAIRIHRTWLADWVERNAGQVVK